MRRVGKGRVWPFLAGIFQCEALFCRTCLRTGQIIASFVFGQSGSSVARYRVCFGSRRSSVRIRPPRPEIKRPDVIHQGAFFLWVSIPCNRIDTHRGNSYTLIGIYGPYRTVAFPVRYNSSVPGVGLWANASGVHAQDEVNTGP